jgi:hypothetical protein
MAASAAIQLGGNLAMWGLDAIGKEEWANRGRQLLSAIDLNRYIRRGSEFVVDGAIEASSALSEVWTAPEVTEIRNLGSLAFAS